MIASLIVDPYWGYVPSPDWNVLFIPVYTMFLFNLIIFGLVYNYLFLED